MCMLHLMHLISFQFCSAYSYTSSKNFIEKEIYRSSDFDSISNVSEIEHDDELCGADYDDNSSSFTVKRNCRIDMSPEAQQKRREAYNSWLKIVNEREKEKKKLQRERIEAERMRKQEEEDKKRLENDAKVREWNERKHREAQKKISRLNEMKQVTERKVNEPKEFKKAIRFEEWVEKKNEEFRKMKARQEEEKKKFKDYVKTRECISAVSYKKWMQTSRNTPKPVPLNRGLESLRGSTTKLYVNPNAWKSTLD